MQTRQALGFQCVLSSICRACCRAAQVANRDSQKPSGIERNEIVKWQRMVSERRKSSLSSSFSRATMAAMTSDGTQSERAKRTLSSLSSLSSPCLISSSASSAGNHDGGFSTENLKCADQFRTNLRNSEKHSTGTILLPVALPFYVSVVIPRQFPDPQPQMQIS